MLPREKRRERLLQRQVEKILDESDSANTEHSIIVQMEEPSGELQRVFRASAEALSRRRLTLSPRELVPANADLILETSELSEARLEKLRAISTSTSSQVALAAVQRIELKSMVDQGLRLLDPLFDSDLVKSVQASSVDRAKRKKSDQDGPPEGFRRSWSSRSAVLRMSRDGLSKLPTTVSGISGVFPNSHVTLPPVAEVTRVPNQIEENTSSAWGIERIGALSAWGAYGTRGHIPTQDNHPIKVAVLDTGVDPDHVELQGRIQDWAEFDVNGAILNTQPHDSAEHGTHVCGTIAGCHPNAPSKDYPLIGVAPDIKLMVGLVLNGGSGTNFQIIAGMDWAIENGADVINMSLGGVSLEPDVGDIYSRSILNAKLRGIPVVISIGNEGAQTSGAPGNDYFALSVGATDYLDRAGGFSGGRTQVIRESRYIEDKYLPLIYSKPEVSAPGVAVRSSLPENRYGLWNGTSMAAPHVSGALALLLAATRIRSVPAQRRAFVLQDLIMSSVEELGESGRDHRFGFGRINVLRAIAFAKDHGY